jgi:predicted dehydrogenase
MAVRIALAGAGLIGRAHAARLRASPTATLAAIADPAPAAAALAGELGVPHFAALAPMLDAIRPDGAIIATPNARHVPDGLACVERGVPALIEKPIADDVAGGARLVEAAESARVPLLVGHHHRHNPIIARARAIVRGGGLGRVATVAGFTTFLKPDPYFDAGPWRREKGGGPVLINLIHGIDDLRFIVGEIASVQAAVSSAIRGFPVEDSAIALLRFEGGALGTFVLSDAAAAPWSWEMSAGENAAFPQHGEDSYRIAGTEGALALPSLRRWRYEGERSWLVPLAVASEAVERADPLVRQLEHFVAVIRGEATPLVSGRDGLGTLAATLAVLDAASSGVKRRLAPR